MRVQLSIMRKAYQSELNDEDEAVWKVVMLLVIRFAGRGHGMSFKWTVSGGTRCGTTGLELHLEVQDAGRLNYGEIGFSG